MRPPPARHVPTPPIQLPPLRNIQTVPQYAAAPQHSRMHGGSADPLVLPSRPARPASTEPFRHIESRHVPPALPAPLRSPNTASWLDPAQLHNGRFDFMDPCRFIPTSQGDIPGPKLPAHERILRSNAAAYPVAYGLPPGAHGGTVARGQPVLPSTGRLTPVGRVPQAQVQGGSVLGSSQNHYHQGDSAQSKRELGSTRTSGREGKMPKTHHA